MFVAAVATAFAYEWRIALLMLGVAPASCMVMSLMARVCNLYIYIKYPNTEEEEEIRR